jgi:hypothetical protein
LELNRIGRRQERQNERQRRERRRGEAEPRPRMTGQLVTRADEHDRIRSQHAEPEDVQERRHLAHDGLAQQAATGEAEAIGERHRDHRRRGRQRFPHERRGQ